MGHRLLGRHPGAELFSGAIDEEEAVVGPRTEHQHYEQ